MTPMDPYSVLGVAPSAGQDEVKAAYRSRARLLHPDFHRDARGGAPQAAHDAFAQLCSAYQLALGNLDTARTTLQGVDESLGRTPRAARPAAPGPAPQGRVTVPPARGAAPSPAAPAAPVVQAVPAVQGPTATESFDWRGTFLLLGLAVLGWLFVVEWLPAMVAYTSR